MYRRILLVFALSLDCLSAGDIRVNWGGVHSVPCNRVNEQTRFLLESLPETIFKPCSPSTIGPQFETCTKTS